MHSARVTSKTVVPGTERARRKPRWTRFFHPRSPREKLALGASVTIVATLVVAGLFYTMTGSSLPPPPQRAPPSDRFADTRAGRIVVPTEDGLCREYSFNNQNGAFGADRVVPCGANRMAAPNSQNEGGFEAFKQAFGKR